ncbi:FAD-dependent thymidylate synthase, partial [Bacillus sp. SIMBA_161]
MDLKTFEESCWNYRDMVELCGQSEEHARRLLYWDVVRQPFVFSGNARSLMHILDLRSKKDAQLEIRALSWAMFN